jgi:hypothetical protein
VHIFSARKLKSRYNIPIMFTLVNSNRGLVKMIVLIVIALLILAYFGLNLRSIVNSPTFQDNWALIRDAVVNVWNTYLKGPATYLWNEIFIKLIWDPAIRNLERMKNDQPTDIVNQSPITSTTTPQVP